MEAVDSNTTPVPLEVGCGLMLGPRAIVLIGGRPFEMRRITPPPPREVLRWYR
jgi:hypothetical protein